MTNFYGLWLMFSISFKNVLRYNMGVNFQQRNPDKAVSDFFHFYEEGF